MGKFERLISVEAVMQSPTVNVNINISALFVDSLSKLLVDFLCSLLVEILRSLLVDFLSTMFVDFLGTQFVDFLRNLEWYFGKNVVSSK